MRRTLWTTALLSAAVALAPLPAGADAIQFKDGRYFEVTKVVEAEGGYKLVFDHGEIFVKKDLVNQVLALDSAGGYTPQNDEEKKQVEKGLLPYEGKWVTKADRDKKIKDKSDKARKEMEEARKHQEWRDRYIEETKHFKFEYTIPQVKAKEYMVLMETYYDVFMKKWKIQVPAKTPKLTICFYHDQEYYYQVSGAPRGAIGYFRFVDPIELNFYYDRNDERLTLDVMFHEANHYLTYLINPKFNYPSWINESLAEYYGASQWDQAKKSMSVGHLQEGRLVVLMDAISGDKPEWQALEEMIRLPDFNALHYAWGWSFVHMLMETKKYSQPFQNFYLEMGNGKDVKREDRGDGIMTCKPDEVIRILKKHIKITDLKVLEKEWHEYVKKLELKSHRGYEDAAQWAENWGLSIKAGRYYQTAVEKGTENPLTFDNYGEWHNRKGNYDDAIKMFDKAIELDPMNAYFYMHLGHAWVNQGDKEKGENLKKLAIDLEPNDPWLQLMTTKIVMGGK